MNIEKMAAALHALADALLDDANTTTATPEKATRARRRKPDPDPEPEPAPPNIAQDDVMKVFQELAKVAGGGAAVKAVLREFGVERISELDASHYIDAMIIAERRIEEH